MKKPRFLRSISFRLLAFNLLIVFFPVASILFLSTYEQQLLRFLEHALVQQGRMIAASLGGTPTLNREEARALLLRLEKKHEARIRILDETGMVLADSSVLPGKPEVMAPQAESKLRWSIYDTPSAPSPDGGATKNAAERFLYRLASFPVRIMRNYILPPAIPLTSGDFYLGRERLLGAEVLAALDGRYGAATRISSGGQVSVTLYSALPVLHGDRITGVVLVSQSTYRILQDLYSLRLEIFRIFLLSLASAVVISVFLSLTISRPLKKLSRRAEEIFSPAGRLQGHFSMGSRKDEIGDLAGSLDGLAEQLRSHIGFIESFAADVSHELKNPIASIRSSAEILADTGACKEAETARFLAIIQREAARMEGLIAALRDISAIDTRLREEERIPVDLGKLAGLVVEEHELKNTGKSLTFQLVIPEEPVYLTVAPLRLTQVLHNIIDNAASFSPGGGEVSVEIEKEVDQAVIRVSDRGPGIPSDIIEKIFDRFYSFRNENRTGEHTGLGLAIVKAVVSGYGGTVYTENREGGGTCVTVKLPEDG